MVSATSEIEPDVPAPQMQLAKNMASRICEARKTMYLKLKLRSAVVSTGHLQRRLFTYVFCSCLQGIATLS